MAKTNKTTKRFGARYGTRVRNRVAEVEALYRNKKLDCPYCSKKAVKRVAMGIWNCRKCNAKFAGAAYSISPVVKKVEVQAR